MPGIVGYFDPDSILADDVLARMLVALGSSEELVISMERNSWAGVGIANYANACGVSGASPERRYVVLGALQSSDGIAISHEAIAEKCFGEGTAPSDLTKIRGGFVAAILDSVSRTVSLVSDRFGSYPLYVYRYKTAWLFSSQIKSILSVMPERPKLNMSSVSTMLSIGEVIGDLSMVEGVDTLPAAATMKIAATGMEMHKYWRYVYEENLASDWEESVIRIGNAIGVAVSRSVHGSTSPAVPLSGGLDSRFLLDIACQEGAQPKAYTWGTPGCRDIEYARDVADRLKCKHETFNFEPDYLARLGDLGVWLTEGNTPAVNFHVLPYVNLLASRGHDRILDGFAGDGVLGGNFISSEWLDQPDLAFAAEHLWRWRRSGFDGGWRHPALTRFHSRAAALFKDAYLEYPGHSSMDKAMAFLIDNRVRRITTCGTELFRSRLPVKQPFMDIDVIDATRTVPHIWRRRHRLYLAVLKDFAPVSSKARYQRSMIPASAPYFMTLLSMAGQRGCGMLEKRVGFPNFFSGKSPSNFREWLKGPLKDYVEQVLLSEKALDRGVVPADFVRDVVCSHMDGSRDFTALIGAMISIENFNRLFIDDISGSISRFSTKAES